MIIVIYIENDLITIFTFDSKWLTKFNDVELDASLKQKSIFEECNGLLLYFLKWNIESKSTLIQILNMK